MMILATAFLGLQQAWDSFKKTVSATGQEMYLAIVKAITDLILWVMDPASLLSAAAKLLGWMVELVAYLIPGPAGETIANLGDHLQDVPISKMVALGGYLASPIIDPNLFLSCFAVCLNAWFILTVVRLAVLVKNHFWSAGS